MKEMKNFRFYSCYRCEGRSERSSARPTPRGGKNVKRLRFAKVSPETGGPLTQLLNENAEDSTAFGFPKRSELAGYRTEANSHIGLAASLEDVSGKLVFATNICSCEKEVGTEENAEENDDEEAYGPCVSCFQRLRAFIGDNLRWWLKKRRNDGSARWREKLESLLVDIRENIFGRLPLKELFRYKVLSKTSEDLAESDALLRLRRDSGSEGSFTAISFFMKENAWQCTGFDLLSKKWRRLPTFACLPTPDTNLFKEYSVCGEDGLMCANVSKVAHKEELIVFNLLSGESRKLPPLQWPRHPVLVHIMVDPATNEYKVVAAGSSSSNGEANLSKKVEVYDSQKMQWRAACDLPGPEFALNEHQSGVCVDGVLYFIAFLGGDGSKGVLAFDVEKGEWLEERSCCVPFAVHSNVLHLVETEGRVYLFSEQEQGGGAVEHCIDVLEFGDGCPGCELKNVMRVNKSGGRGLLVYPEYTIVPFGEGKLCVFNTIKRDGVIYDIQSGKQCEVLEEPPVDQRGDNFFCLNPVSFTLQPNFVSKP